NRREQRDALPPVVVRRDAEMGPAGDVPERERQPGLEDLVGDLGRVERRLEWERLLLRIAVRPLHSLAGLLGLAQRLERLGPGDHGDVVVAVEDGAPGVLHEDLRRRAADAGVVAVTRRDAERVREPTGRIVVLPALAV